MVTSVVSSDITSLIFFNAIFDKFDVEFHFFYTLHACKILRWLEINNHLIYKMFKAKMQIALFMFDQNSFQASNFTFV